MCRMQGTLVRCLYPLQGSAFMNKPHLSIIRTRTPEMLHTLDARPAFVNPIPP